MNFEKTIVNLMFKNKIQQRKQNFVNFVKTIVNLVFKYKIEWN